ncbi:MAG: aminotransferase class I/II-fold pyridoxal phosphate-dependent enzyme, partial [Clostridia bacterium]|nr:aminotransferase class I/II-fold pyridoxal phosphate-dependent enzyme [Clostridia bacterium]
VLYLVKNSPCLVVVDEAYMDFGDQSVLQYVEEYNNLIVLRTMSKAFACAALRVGFAVANCGLIQILKAVKSPYNVNNVSQTFAKILLGYKSEAKAAIRCIIDSRDELYAELAKLVTVMGSPFAPLAPNANFVYIKTDKAEEIYKKLLSDGIAIRCFKNRIRISAGSKSENAEIIKKLRSYQ